MPGIHSEFNYYANNEDEFVCEAPIFPLRTTNDNSALDIVDEAIRLYRLNVLYKNYTIEGRADIILVYLMSFIAECLNALPKITCTRAECLKIFQSKVFSGLELPGSAKFNLGMLFGTPRDDKEREAIKNYFIQLRNECAKRLAQEICEGTENGNSISKWWFSFHKRKFMFNPES